MPASFVETGIDSIGPVSVGISAVITVPVVIPVASILVFFGILITLVGVSRACARHEAIGRFAGEQLMNGHCTEGDSGIFAPFGTRLSGSGESERSHQGSD